MNTRKTAWSAALRLMGEKTMNEEIKLRNAMRATQRLQLHSEFEAFSEQTRKAIASGCADAAQAAVLQNWVDGTLSTILVKMLAEVIGEDEQERAA
jgi:hypothetical protein